MYLQESASPVHRLSSAGCVQTALSQCNLLSAEGEQTLFKRLSVASFRAEAIEKSIDSAKPAKRKMAELEKLRGEAESIRNEIAIANLRLVASIAAKVARSGGDFDDFFAEGNAILLKCIEKFDYTRGFRFSTYATTAIQRHLYRMISQKTRRRQQEWVHDVDVLNQIPGQPSDQAVVVHEFNTAEAIIAKIDETLDERESYIVRGRLGLDGTGRGQTFQHLGEHLGLSKERIRQLFNRGIEKLSELAANLELDPVAQD
jgi:RNA polymerase sigma factor (sigma-70 family)